MTLQSPERAVGQYSKLMLITDTAEEATPAFKRAVHLARATRAELHVVAFVNDPAIDALASLNLRLMERTRHAYLAEQQVKLHALLDPLLAEGVTVHLELVAEPAFGDVVLARIAALKPDLVLKDVQPEPLLKRILLGGLDWTLVNQSPADLLFVNQRAAQLPSRVIAAVDTSYGADGLNDRIVRAALALATQCDADAQLVHVTNYHAPVNDSTLLGDSALVYRELMKLDREQFEAMAQRFNVPAERRHLLSGSVPQALAELVRDPLGDVLAIGAAYRTRLERLLLGRNAQSILQKAACDVLVVKPAEWGAAEAGAAAGPGAACCRPESAHASRPSP